jgi:hypothetical protein
MRTEGRQATVIPIALSAAALLWPAVWNGYPLVFADTGTYLSQAIERHLGWDRPVFYSLFLLPLHMTLTTWTAIAAEALLAAHTLHLVRRALLRDISAWWLAFGIGLLSLATSLPWFASQLMPDIFTGLLPLVLALLVLVPERLSRRERIWLVLFAAFMTAAHQSHVPLTACLLLVLLPLRRRLGAASPARFGVLTALSPLVLALFAATAVNAVAFGRLSPSPFGNVFLLARVIYDGPGADVLRRECPQAGWRLCRFIDQLPPNSDDFLWRRDGPVVRAGGARQVSDEAGAIIAAALRAAPGAEARAFLRNCLSQLVRFASGDGLEAWPDTVTPVIERDFPAFERFTYATARQTQGRIAVPAWMQSLHRAAAIAGVIICIAALPIALRRRQVAGGFIVAVLLALLGNAAITGGLSGPHDRYQSRVMWLPPALALLVSACLLPSGASVASRTFAAAVASDTASGAILSRR